MKTFREDLEAERQARQVALIDSLARVCVAIEAGPLTGGLKPGIVWPIVDGPV